MKKKDLAFHPNFGLLKIVEITKTEEGEISEMQAKALALDKETVTLLQDDITLLTKQLTISTKIYLGDKSSVTSNLTLPLKRGATFESFLSGLESIIGTPLAVFMGGKPIDEKAKISKTVKSADLRMLAFAKGSGAASKPEGIRWWSRFPVNVNDS